jgi:hypothetical protein
MKIVINNHRKIYAIQEEFSSMFPDLKIGFHAKPHNTGGPPSPQMVKHSGRTLQDCRTSTRKGTIDILPTMNLADLKEHFRDVYGLSVEVVNKGGHGPDTKPASDDLTLQEMNKHHSA